MAKYNKAIGTLVGAVVGIVLVGLGVSDGAGIPVEWQPIVDTITTTVLAILGTYFAPKNAA